LNGFASGIKKGRQVKQGQVIGYVGKTGRVTGVHLHYNVMKNGRPVNPVKLVLPPSKGISNSELEAYKDAISSLRDQLHLLTDEEKIVKATY
jgi:murein DD-endopeptidase MepM/ murein hydrolase activator NlpD